MNKFKLSILGAGVTLAYLFFSNCILSSAIHVLCVQLLIHKFFRWASQVAQW